MKNIPQLLLALLIAPCVSFAQASAAEPATNVTFCELSRDPAAYNHKLVRLTAFVTHGFEDFGAADPECLTQGFGIWLMYGGKAESNTMYCCPGEASQETRAKPLDVEGIQLPLVDDQTFQRFTALLKREPDTIVRTTLTGRFFAGKKVLAGTSASWRGFGHMGCCSLLAIQGIESFEPHTRTDLDYTAEAGWYENEGCKWGGMGYKRHVSIIFSDGKARETIAEQQAADGGRAWAFTDPQRVAMESLGPLYPGQVPVLRRVKETVARQVFQWRNGKKSIVVVVTCPYWLSFYAASNSVAWVTTTIKEAECK